MKKNILITGVTGFIGINLISKISFENYNIYAIVRNDSYKNVISEGIQKNITFYNIEEYEILDIVKKVNPNVVIHLASLFLSSHEYNDIDSIIASNITLGTKLLDAMRFIDNKNIIITGSYWQHYQNEEYNPVNLYAASKQAFEDITKYYIDKYKYHVINLQLFDTYGNNDRRKKIIALFKEAEKNNLKLNMSLGEQLIDLVHVNDVVDAYLLAMKYLLNNEYEKCGTYGVSSGEPISLKKLAVMYEQIHNCKLNIIWGGREYREREVMIPWNRYAILPKWSPKIKLKNGIKNLI